MWTLSRLRYLLSVSPSRTFSGPAFEGEFATPPARSEPPTTTTPPAGAVSVTDSAVGRSGSTQCAGKACTVVVPGFWKPTRTKSAPLPSLSSTSKRYSRPFSREIASDFWPAVFVQSPTPSARVTSATRVSGP